MPLSYSLFFYLIAAVCFILGLHHLASPTAGQKANRYSTAGMIIAILTVLASPEVRSYSYILLAVMIGGTIGILITRDIKMAALPQLIAGFHSFIGLAAVLIAWASYLAPEYYGIGEPGNIKVSSLVEMAAGAAIGAVTFSGSLVAFAKLHGLLSTRPVHFTGQHKLNAFLGIATFVLIGWFSTTHALEAFASITAIAFVLGFLLVLPIGGADMPVIVAMLNSYSGWATAGIGFTLQNNLLIIIGALVGSSGAILSYIICKAMNRSFFNVLLGGLHHKDIRSEHHQEETDVNVETIEKAVGLLKKAKSVIVIPGYGMAASDAQFSLAEMELLLKDRQTDVRYAIHPVAGRMPGHMNVLLAEAGIPYENVYELEDINANFMGTDVVYIIGANDITNPLAKSDEKSPIFGMPVLNAGHAKNIIVVKHSLGNTGYAGIKNPLFYASNTVLLLGDAKSVTEEIIAALKQEKNETSMEGNISA